MAQQHQNTFESSSRRYSVSTLLQLARTGPPPFDLSKFTYDAARAGVVPPLGDCAVSLRRTSGNRPRGWSTETVSTTEDPSVVLGNSVQVVVPERRPRIPPAGEKAQKDEGFARFLKNHSSPTHKRVTAGGRIVPMEKRDSPPKFELPETDYDQRSILEPMKPRITEMANGTVMLTKLSVDGEHAQTPPGCASLLCSGTEGSDPGVLRDSQARNPQLSTSPSLHPDPAASLPYSPALPIDYAWNEPTPFINPATVASAYQPYVQAAFHPSPLAHLGGALHRLPQIPITLGYPRLYVEQQLGEAQDRFDHLSQQLQAFDAFQAQGSYQIRQDPARGHHRRAIVDHRDVARQWLNFWRKRKDEMPSTPEAFMVPSQMSVQAPAYVPQDVSHAMQADPISTPASKPVSDAHVVEKQASAPRRKAIPIVRPPETIADRRTSVQEDTKTDQPATSTLVEAHKQDNVTTTFMQHSFPQAAAQEVRLVPQKEALQVEAQLELAQSCFVQDKESRPEEIEQWDAGTINLAPTTPELAQFYEHISDAMRLPVGVISHVLTPQRTEIVVFGANLQQPASANMTEQEAEYWRRKPIFNQDMLAHVKRVARIEDMENYDDEQLLGNKPLPAGLVAKAKAYGLKTCQDSNEYEGSLLAREDSGPLDAGLGRHDMFPRTEVKEGEGTAVVACGKSCSSTTSLTENFDGDSMNNKTFSSTGISHVTAIAMLPTYDGAGDASRRNAKSLLSLVGRWKSPRLVQRATPTGSAWYGPYSRDFKTQTQSEGS